MKTTWWFVIALSLIALLLGALLLGAVVIHARRKAGLLEEELRDLKITFNVLLQERDALRQERDALRQQRDARADSTIIAI